MYFQKKYYFKKVKLLNKIFDKFDNFIQYNLDNTNIYIFIINIIFK